MAPLHRSLLWLGTYVALVLGPLAAAWLLGSPPPSGEPRAELAAAAGLVAFGILAVELALVARLRPLSRVFGTDVLMLFHRWMGLAGLAFAIAHPALLRGRGVDPAALLPTGPGAIALWALALLVGSSVARRRLRLPYGTWRTGHVVLAVVVLGATLHHVREVAGAGEPVVAAASVWTAGFLALLVHYRLVRPLALWRRPWSVEANRDEGGDTRTLVLRPEGRPTFDFRPGQFVWLKTGRTPFGADDHPISISSSAERRGSIELSIKALGDWSRDVVPRIAPGERVFVDGPYGSFTPDTAPAQGFVLIAGGIGITPMRSILLTLRDRGDPRPVLLIHAAHDASRAVFTAELDALTAAMPLRVVRVWEAPAEGEDVEAGFVTTELLRRHLPPDARRRAFFCCGPAPMMGPLQRSLAALAIPAENVHAERFDMV